MVEARVSRLALVLGVCLAACGGAAPHATESTTVAPPTAIAVSRAPWSITFANDSVLAFSAEGALTIDRESLGTLDADGRLMRDGEAFATLAPDGSMTLDGEDLAPRIEGDRMTEGGVAVLEIDEDDALHVRAPDGRELAEFDVDGAAPEARPTILFLTAVYLLESARARADDDDDPRDEADQDARAAGDDEDLWRMPVDDAPFEGPADALVTIVELTDFQCPYCSRGAAAMTAIRARFPDDVRLVVRQRPLPFHENARPAAEAALEARAQLGDPAFFRMSALLFANQRVLTRPTLEALAIAVGLDLARFRHALDEDAHEEAIARDESLGDRMGAEGTPTFYVNGELIIGAQPLTSFVHAVERARARAEAALAGGAPRDHLYEALLADARDRSASEAEAIPPAPDVHFVDLVVPDDAPASGSSVGRARTTVQVFVDLGSTHAAAARTLLERLAADPVRAARIVLRLAPRESTASHIASEAVMAVTAASGADAGFRYAMELASTPDDLSTAHLSEAATRIAHVPSTTLRAALDAHSLRSRVDRDRRALHDASLDGAPVLFVVGRRVLWGLPTFEALTTAVDAAISNPDDGHPTAPSDVAHAPSGAHASAGGASWLTEHAGDGDGAESMLLARWAIWGPDGLVFDGTTSEPLHVRLDGLEPALGAALHGIRHGEIRRVWLPGSRAVYVEAVDVD